MSVALPRTPVYMRAVSNSALPGGSATSPGPVGDLIYNNHIARYLDAVSFTSGSKANIFRENTLAYFNLAFRASTVFGPNDTVAEGNIMTQLPTP